MVNFLRKIRLKTISENKLRNYMFYAVGEIVLVVIGILIALQINSWNDYRKERKNEQLLLLNLKENLITDKQLLEQFYKGANDGLNAVDTILLMVNGHIRFNYNSFSRGLEKILTNNYFQTTSTTFDQAISTGKIDLILSENLRSEILNYYKLTKLNFEDNQLLDMNQDYVFPIIFSLIVPTKSISYALSGIETNLPELDLPALASNPEFNTWVIFKKSAYQRQAENYSFLQEEISFLTTLIDEQLE